MVPLFILMFQFHYGSIKSQLDLAYRFRKLSFNSIMVRLKDGKFVHENAIKGCFNSIMVRLKGYKQVIDRLTLVSFNSIMVRLKASPPQ